MKTINTQLSLSTYRLPITIICMIIIFGCSSDSSEKDEIFNPELYTYVPDDNFEQLLINQNYDDKLDNYVLTSKIINVTSLLFTGGNNGIFDSSGISNFRGIEDFISLESFDCSGLNLTYLDLSNNVALKTLHCEGNQLTILDLSNLIVLENLDCSYNNLSSLILNSSSLIYLSCHENNLGDIEISQATNLVNLSCFRNKLTSLDLSNNIDLEILQAGDNLFANLDISNNVALTYIECFLNPMLTCVQVNEEQLNNNWTFCSNELFSLNCN